MLHLSDNIKIIRKLAGLNQKEFAKLFNRVTLPMQKSYEQGKANPDGLYLQTLADISGIPEEKLINTQVRAGDVKLKLSEGEKEEKGEFGQLLNNDMNNKTGELPSAGGGVIDQLVNSNRLLAEAAKTHAEANIKHAEANIKFAEGQLVLAKNQETLLRLIKPEGTIASGFEVALQAFGTKLAAIEDVFSAELTKGRSEELERIREALHNREVEIQDLIKHVSSAEGAGI